MRHSERSEDSLAIIAKILRRSTPQNDGIPLR